MALRDKLQQLSEGLEAHDAESIKAEWTAALVSLVQFFEKSLKDYIDSGLISITPNYVTLTEERLGFYSALGALIRSGNSILSLEPIGRMIAGYRGRADLVSKSRPGYGFALLRAMDEESGGTAWHIVGRKPVNLLATTLGPLNYGPVVMDVLLTKENLEIVLDKLL